MNVTTALGMCAPKQSIPWHFEHERDHSFNMCKDCTEAVIPQPFEHERYHNIGHV